MAKRKLKAKRSAKPEDVLKRWAADLREHADFLDACAKVYQRTKGQPFRILPGNFYLWLSKLRATFSKQVVQKMIDAASGGGKQHYLDFSALLAQLGELEEKMASDDPAGGH